MKIKIQKPLKSYEIFHFVKEKLGKEYLLHLWGFKHASSIYMWCADPNRAEYIQPNPLDKICTMLEDLNALGHRDIALAAVRCLARPIGFEVRDPRDIQTDKEDPNLEFLDVINAIGEVSKELQGALEDQILDEEEKAKVLEAADEAIKQLMQLKDAVRKK